MTEEEYRTAQFEREKRRDEAEIELNQNRYLLEDARFRRENRFWNRHLAATVSLLAVIVTASQLWFGIKKDERDRAAQSVRDERDNQAQASESALIIGRLLIERQAELFSSDANTRQRARDALLLDLPRDKEAKLRIYFDRVEAVRAAVPAPPEHVRPTQIEFHVPAIDDRIRVRVNGASVYEGGTTGWQTAALSAGRNVIEVEVYNQASYTGGIEFLGGHKREGWNYAVTFRAEGIEERPFSDRRDEPPIEQFGAWFTVQKLGVTVDPASGAIDGRTFLTP